MIISDIAVTTKTKMKRRIPARLLAALTGIALLLGLAGAAFAVYTTPSTTASTVWGQSGSFTTYSSGTTADSLNVPRGVAIAPDGSVFIADSNNYRVLRFTAGSTTASMVWGQSGV